MQKIYERALAGEHLSHKEALRLWREAPLYELASHADRLRAEKVADREVVTWQIDRNINTTNVCVSGCRFCNFHCKPHQTDRHFITSLEEYIRKTEEMFALGGDQLLLQGGMRLAQHRAASRPGLCAIAPGRRAGAPPVWNSHGPSQYSLASTRRQPASSLPRSGHWAPNLGPK